MLRMKSGSIGEIPPSTRRTRGLSARTASAARFTIPANWVHPWSIVKSQCERLFGSFQSITASTTRVSPPADIDFVLGMIGDLEPRASQHRFGAGTIRNPPVRRVVRVSLLHEIHRGVILTFE